MKHCSECKKGEVYDNPAQFKATGTILKNSWGKIKRIPWRAFICDGHADVISIDEEVNGDPIENFKTTKLNKGY